MKQAPSILAALALTATSACADSFGSGGNAFTINFLNIGNAGNADDAGAGGGIYSSPYGGVTYLYRMGTFEVSEDAITKATAGGLLNVTAGAWAGPQPAANMTWYEAAAFVNFLNTSTGHVAAYQIDAGVTALTLWNSGQAWQADGENLYRNKDAFYFLPNEDEWYKAAFHKNDGVTADYWDYATSSNTIPTAVASGMGAGTAVYNGGVVVAPAAVNNAGGLSAYGTMGQDGNVFEWMESATDGVNDVSSENRAFRGGGWTNPASVLQSSLRLNNPPATTFSNFGFRVASAPVGTGSAPEPNTAALALLGAAATFATRRRARSFRHG